MTTRLSTAAGVAVLAVGLAATVAAPAWARLSSTVSPATPVRTATLAAPTSAAASATCNGASKSWVTVSWVATASAFATGYAVSRSVNGGAYSLVATLSGRTTSSWVDSSISAKTTYAYRVVATYRSWTSAGAGASVTTGKNC